jgi:RNA polymerase sigma factor (sigma-70 family)
MNQKPPHRGTGDSVAHLVARLNAGAGSPSVLRRADRVLRRAEPAARATCRAEAGHLPAHIVEELVQDSLEIVWTRLAEFEPEGPPFEAWVRGIALNVCRNARRKHRDVLTDDGVIEETDPSHGVLRVLQREQREALLTEAIEAALEGNEQDVLYHRYMHGLSREQIADLMGLADADAVRVILVRARRRLRNEIVARLTKLRHSQSLLHSEEG